jgi:hypothetical protein
MPSEKSHYDQMSMYQKTQQPPAEPLTRRDKRGMAIAGAVLLAALSGAGIWAAVHPGGYGQSRDGCVTVTAPSSTGGALLHACGSGARTMCHNAFASGDRLSVLTRPQCRLAGLGPGRAPVRSGASP